MTSGNRRQNSIKRWIILAGIGASGLSSSPTAVGVPTSFLLQPSGTQADVTWGRMENERFVIYYDSSQRTLAEHALQAVERAYPDISLLLGTTLKGQPPPPELKPEQVLTSRFNKVPIIVSSRSDGASFANFIPQTLEIQSTETPPASLFQHELSHRLMYEHMDLNVGPAGRTFMLAMLPSWWTEGLPEYLTESLGRIETQGYLRAMALNDTFLSWDRLHSLYKASGDTSIRGYALSGRFFKYFLERTPSRDLRELHTKLTTRQLVPPFFTGAYFLIHSLTGKWPGDLYETFKTELKNQIIADLEGMPRLKNVPNIQKVFQTLGNGNFVSRGNTIISADFSTNSRAGGLEVYKFNNKNKSKLVRSFLNPLKIQANDRIFIHPMEWQDGGFWTTSRVTASNRTSGHVVSYYKFKGAFDELKDENISERIDFTLGEETQPPIIRSIVTTSPENAAALATIDTESRLYILNKKLRQHSLLGQWQAPNTVSLVRPHPGHAESESRLCAHVLVNADDEKTSIQRVCHGESVQTIIPEGEFYIRDAVMLGPDDFILLTAWHDVQALVRWTHHSANLITGLPDWVTSIEPTEQPETLMLRVYTGGNIELWQASLTELKKSHLAWLISRPEKSKWWTPPRHQPYVPPFARYAAEVRKSAGTLKALKDKPRPPLLAATRTAMTESVSETPVVQPPTVKETETELEPQQESPSETQQADSERPTTENDRPPQPLPNDVVIEELDPKTNARVSIPAPYRYRHWMSYPNALPPFLAGNWTFGFFSRPFVDEMERFYAQVFGTYYLDSDIALSDRLALEVNLVGNRLFDGWKANVFMRPRFNGLTGCRFANDPNVYVCQLYLREIGTDLQLNRKISSLDALTDIHSRLYSISPSSRGNSIGAPSLGAQDALLINVGGSMAFNTWDKVIFDRPVSDLAKRSYSLGGSLRFSVDTTHSLGAAKAGNGEGVSPVSFQNYSAELTNSAQYDDHLLTLRNSYSATGGGAPLNAKEFFRPFKTYIIGANDGLQDISTAIAGNGLLSFNLTGRAQYRNSLSYTFPLVRSLDTRFAIAYLEKLDGEVVLSRGGTSNEFALGKTRSISTLTGSVRLKVDVKGYQFNPAILYGRGLDNDLWQLFTQIKFDQFW